MTELAREARELQDLIRPIVAAIVKELKPERDSISISKANKTYGKTWIRNSISDGDLEVWWKGQRRYLSVSDIEALKAAQSQRPTIRLKL